MYVHPRTVIHVWSHSIATHILNGEISLNQDSNIVGPTTTYHFGLPDSVGIMLVEIVISAQPFSHSTWTYSVTTSHNIVVII